MCPTGISLRYKFGAASSPGGEFCDTAQPRQQGRGERERHAQERNQRPYGRGRLRPARTSPPHERVGEYFHRHIMVPIQSVCNNHIKPKPTLVKRVYSYTISKSEIRSF
jgi:hypothetical protein